MTIRIGIGIDNYKGASGGAVAPSNTVAPVASGTAIVGQTLSVTNGTWTGTAPITYTYQWKRNNVNIGSATNATYVLVAADVNTSIKCTVTATNTGGSASQDSNVITPISTERTGAFISAASISDATIITALNTMDLDLISAGLLPSGTGAGKLVAIYPMAGGTATTHKFNFVNPADTNAAYRLGFSGGWTHNSSGATPNGTNCYADTYLNDSTLTYNDNSAGYYSLNNSGSGSRAVIGCNWDASPYNVFGEYAGGNIAYWFTNGSNITNASGTLTGLLCINNKSNVVKMYKNGSAVGSSLAPNSAVTNTTIYVGGARGLLTNTAPCAWAYIGSGLTAGEQSSLYTLVQAYQTTMGRQV